MTDEKLIKEAAEAIKPLFESAGLVDLDAEDYAWDAARAAAVVFEKAHAPQITDAMIHAAAHALVEHDDPGVYERGDAVPNYDEYVSAARAALEAALGQTDDAKEETA